MATAWNGPWHSLDGVIVRDHAPLRRELRRAIERARSLEPDGPNPGEDGEGIVTGDLVQRLVELNALVDDHLWREETFLFALLRFPVLRVEPGAVKGMRCDHAAQLSRLQQIRRHVEAEADCGRPFDALGRDLERVEQRLRDLIDLEEHYVFAQSLAGGHLPSGYAS